MESIGRTAMNAKLYASNLQFHASHTCHLRASHANKSIGVSEVMRRNATDEEFAAANAKSSVFYSKISHRLNLTGQLMYTTNSIGFICTKCISFALQFVDINLDAAVHKAPISNYLCHMNRALWIERYKLQMVH